MWMVFDYEEGIVLTTESHVAAKECYKKQKNRVRDYTEDENEFSMDERVILSKVEKCFYSYPENDTHWDFKEDTY